MEKLAANAAGKTIRSTENLIFTAVSGKGKTIIGDRTFEWSRGDTFCVPSWHAFRHAASEDAVLFNVSDCLMQEKLGFLRIETVADA